MKRLILLIIPLMLVMMMKAEASVEGMPTLSINGEGTVEAAPDRATISIGVVTQDRDATQAQNANAKSAQGIIKAISELGIERRNIRTSDYHFRPTYRPEENRRNEISGYMVSNTINVAVDNLDLVGKVIDTALNHGANNINSLDFGIKNRQKLMDEALIAAVKDARRKAELIARELGKTITGISDVSVSTGGISAPRVNKMIAADAMLASQTPIEAGTLMCSASAHITFILSK